MEAAPSTPLAPSKADLSQTPQPTFTGNSGFRGSIRLPFSKQALRLGLLVPPALYLLAVLLGMTWHTGVLLGTARPRLPLLISLFERKVFRPYGSLLPFGILALRVLIAGMALFQLKWMEQSCLCIRV